MDNSFNGVNLMFVSIPINALNIPAYKASFDVNGQRTSVSQLMDVSLTD
ncbi:MAG: hypothetical protein GW856_10175 [Cyanobacteria bacterium]|nr:hypothetical protein [Cyanobacteria bacterium CG_2015-16_32_12]NCO77650.1 hypothetical protein [Cyanobacteria bacterium CG_2015-22_32_23]NCQ04118.1 hypothetical protein [Cyanobacteria bacterium CG_2015-09_32_10]NCS85933.1 hypothetical protein [Cyanobacteria bacterium CG_2015-02_32_10]